MSEQVVEVKTLEDKPRKLQRVDGRRFTNCVRNVIEKAVSICVIIQQDRKVKKKFNLTHSLLEISPKNVF